MMMNFVKSFGLVAIAAAATACNGDVIFEPAGNWSFGEFTVTGSSTYLNSQHDVNVEYDYEEMFGSTPAPSMVAFTYNDAPMELRRGLYVTDTHYYRNELS